MIDLTALGLGKIADVSWDQIKDNKFWSKSKNKSLYPNSNFQQEKFKCKGTETYASVDVHLIDCRLCSHSIRALYSSKNKAWACDFTLIEVRSKFNA